MQEIRDRELIELIRMNSEEKMIEKIDKDVTFLQQWKLSSFDQFVLPQ